MKGLVIIEKETNKILVHITEKEKIIKDKSIEIINIEDEKVFFNVKGNGDLVLVKEGSDE